jgi:small ligand-binding sensory domain FIST
MASGSWGPGKNRLLLGKQVLDHGALALLVSGAVAVRNVVSQGCRPIGRPFVVTKAERNVIQELGGVPALVQLQQLFATLAPEEQQLARGGLHVGQVINEYQETFGRGDFLVRNVQGVDPQSGAIAIGDWVRVGQTVQFHVRDAATAHEDFDLLLAAAKGGNAARSTGALVFTCNGRGTRLFDAPHHDAAAVESHWPGIPTAGFFAQGEIGPVGGKNFLHGFTASVALFGPAT